MFIGHFAVGLASKKAAPKVSLGTLFLAAQFMDLLWPLFLLLGIEHVRIDPGNTPIAPLDFYDYPITHSLAGSLILSAVVGLVYYAIRRQPRGAWILGLCVFSHWILDFVTHRPDLPLAFGTNMYFGLGLWYSVVGTLVVEFGLFAAGVALYQNATVARDRIGSYGFWSLIVLLAIIYIANTFGPPPPSVTAIAIGGNAAWLFVAWAYWVDRHRTASVGGPVAAAQAESSSAS